MVVDRPGRRRSWQEPERRRQRWSSSWAEMEELISGAEMVKLLRLRGYRNDACKNVVSETSGSAAAAPVNKIAAQAASEPPKASVTPPITCGFRANAHQCPVPWDAKKGNTPLPLDKPLEKMRILHRIRPHPWCFEGFFKVLGTRADTHRMHDAPQVTNAWQRSPNMQSSV
jgi:hypothetical protein